MTGLLFDLPPAPRPLPALIRRRAEISACGTLRWTLERAWGSGPHVCWIGLNPATADGRVDDQTSWRWTRFAHGWGYARWVAVNMYPFRSADPAACRRWADWQANGPDWHVRDAIHHNVDVVAREAKRADLVVACWGAGAWDDALVEHVIEAIQTGEAPWPDLWCLGRTAGGAPIHPMARGRKRVPDDARPVLWREAGA